MTQKSLIAIGVLFFATIVCFLIDQLMITPSPLTQDKEKVIGDIIQNWQHSHPSDNRFVILAAFQNTAVLDKETDLVWELAPEPTRVTWNEARIICRGRATGGKKGWRLPAPGEMRSLVGPAVDSPVPHLPPGHPFLNIQPTSYWTVVPEDNQPSYAQYVDAFLGNVLTFLKIYTYPVWCVRGPVIGKDLEP
jgi:hypothetical protein